MLDGDPGIGKSMALVQIAANLSQQYPFLDQMGEPTLMPDIDGPAATLILSAEDSLAHVMKPRLMRAGADPNKIRFLRGWLDPKGQHHSFDLQHMPVLIDAIKTVKPVLVVLDPLVAYLGNIDMHRSNQTRPLMEQLRDVAEQHDCTILGIRHPSKLDQGGPLMYRGQGNMDIVGAARSALWVQKHPIHPETQSIMLHSKTNIATLGRTVIFSREDGEFKWCGVTRLTEPMFTGKGPDPHAFLEAFFWLEETMKPGIPYESSKIDDDAEAEGINHKTLNRAKKALGVRSKKDGSRWLLILPSLTYTHTTTCPTSPTTATSPTSPPSTESTTYNSVEQEAQGNQVAHVDQVGQVGQVVLRSTNGHYPETPEEPYTCECGHTLAGNQKVCFRCGEPRSLPLL
jgi:hypothetical protein